MSDNPLNRWEIGAALGVLAVGLALLWFGSDYRIGSPRRMGPGFFPVVIGTVLALFSVGLVAEALRTRTKVEGVRLRPFLMIMLSIFTFALLMEKAGLVPATFALVLLGAAAERPFRPVRTLLLAAVVSGLGVGIFIWALNLPLDPFAW